MIRKSLNKGIDLSKRFINYINNIIVKRYFFNEYIPISDLEIHFFTLLLNGMPFIKYHMNVLQQLKIPWKWHIIEGVADLKHDTAWSLKTGGKIISNIHMNGLSIDSTTKYIDMLSNKYKDQIFVYRKPNGQFWDGKLEMCNAILCNLPNQCLLWQVDVDEFWSIQHIQLVYDMFKENPGRSAAWFYCNFFVGPNLAVISRNTFGNNTSYEWIRVWHYKKGMVWIKHEPPTLVIPTILGKCNVAEINPFYHNETEALGLRFDHYAYTMKEQLIFKESYYGYKGALDCWKKLQENKIFPTNLRQFFPWVKDDAIVDIFEPQIKELFYGG